MPLSPSYYKPDHQAFVTQDPAHLTLEVLHFKTLNRNTQASKVTAFENVAI